MSADNWTHCPRCTFNGTAALEARRAAVDEAYGTVPVAEFDEARRQHAAAVAAFERREKTFREDYEITGAEDGTVVVKYSGSCTKCRLDLHFTDSHPIPGWAS